MSTLNDPWYVRFPDGRVRRAASTEIVRLQLEDGRIPLGSLLRRTPEEEWTALEWNPEFADLVGSLLDNRRAAGTKQDRSPETSVSATEGGPGVVSTAPVSSRLDSAQLQTVSVADWLPELLAALDSVRVRKKLAIAALGGLVLGIVLALYRAGWLELGAPGNAVAASVAGVIVLLVVVFEVGLLNQLTYLELSQLRPARWREGLADLGYLTFRLLLAYLLLLLVVSLVVGGLLWLSFFLLAASDSGGNPWQAGAAVTAGVLSLLGMVLLLPLFCVSLLLGPVLVVENCSAWKALGKWCGLLRSDLGRVLANEVLAFGLGVLVTLPFVLPVRGLYLLPLPDHLTRAGAITCPILTGLAVAPLLAYLTVANLFIYLNLRYGAQGRPRR